MLGLRARDPIMKLRQQLLDAEQVNEPELEEIETRAKKEVDEAYQFARDSDYPKPEAALDDVFTS